jgi:Uma2 family endonuclease
MSTTTLTTAEQLLKRSNDGHRYELVAGELKMMSPSGWRHGEIVGNLHGLLWQQVRAKRIGVVFGAETGFLIGRNPDTVRAPDIAFIAKQHVPAKKPEEAYWPGAPDLAVEVLSPSDKTGDVDEKIAAWLAAGAAAVWVVDPKLKTVTVYQSTTNIQVKTSGEMLQDDSVVPGFSCAVDDIFE